ncbi:MAG: DUF6775 family putative metallopeptidase [candidate division WOR-3 bacterium]
MYIPSFIYLYNGAKTESLNIEEICKYLKNIFVFSEIKIRDEFVKYYLSNLTAEEKEKNITYLSKELAKIKVRTIEKKNIISEPLPGEIEYEKRRLSSDDNKSFGVIYDGFELVSIFSKLISKKESSLNHCHIIFTNQLFASWDENDLRYHLRVAIYSFPSIISTTGIVEAPAKPKEFYLKKQLGIELYMLKQEFAGKFIDYDDPRMTGVMKGYVLQAIFYHMTGDPFCKDKNCRLYNAHWQQEVIQAQLNNEKEFCNKHKEMIRSLNLK